MDFRVLGPLEVRDGERVLALGGPKRRALAALLLMAENHPVPASRLVDGMWGEEPPAAAASSLQNQVSRLRSVIGDRLETTAAGYVLRVGPGELDLDRFRRLLAEARASEPAAAAERLRQALALWRGPALADLEGEPAHAAGAHLEELRLTALEERIGADLRLGRHADLVPELESLTAEHPFRERLWGHLVLALYGAGRQASALDAFARARRVLVEELGTEPGPALRELHARILRQDPTLDLPRARPRDEEPAPARMHETRRTVSVVIATFAVGNDDPEARREALRRISAEAARTIERHGGTPASASSGERCLGVFGAPRAHEDDALRALRAAFELWSDGAVAAAGIATGEVVTGSPAAGDALVSGAPLEDAERLLEIAAADGVVVSERTWRLVRHAAAGDPEAGGYRIARIDATAPTLIRRLDTPLVGRDEELADVVRTFERAARDARPQLLTVFGEPGIGKTRLATEATRHLASQATVVVGRCEAHGSDATYAPLREVVTALGGDSTEGLFAVMRDEPEGELVATRIAAALGAAVTAGPVQETAWAVRRLLEKLARGRPVVLLLEDIHWAAPALLDLVEHVVDVGRAPILVMCLARPDLIDSRPGWAGGKVNSSSLVLRALSTDEAARLLDGLVEGTGLARGERERIVGAAEGNPLFLEQLLAAALDESPGGVPDSIQALVAARLDRLPSEEREVLDAAAVCGVTFSVGAVAELVGRDVRQSVDELVRRDLLRPADVPLFGEETLAFAHALIHDASYRSVTKRRRAALHEACAARLARVSLERELDLDELVGHHLESAATLLSETGERGTEARVLAQRAGRRLSAAGLRAYERHDAAAAVSLLRRAVQLLGDEEPERSEAQLALANGLLWLDEDAEAKHVLSDVRRTAERRADARVLARLSVAERQIPLWEKSVAPADQVLAELDRAIAVLEEAGDDRGLAEAYQLQFHALDRGTASTTLMSALYRALHHARRAGSAHLESWTQAWMCIVVPFGGDPVSEALQEVTRIRDTTPNLMARGSAIGATGLLRAMQGEFEEGRRLELEARAILDELGLRHDVAAQSIARAEVEILAGDLAAAEEILRDGYEQLQAFGEKHATSNVAWRLALVLTRTGRDDEAEPFTRIAEEVVPHGFWVDVWWRVLRAGIAARAGRVGEADDLLGAALTMIDGFGETGMRVDSWIEAAGVLRVLGRDAEAEELLDRAAALARRLEYTVAERRAAELGNASAATP